MEIKLIVTQQDHSKMLKMMDQFIEKIMDEGEDNISKNDKDRMELIGFLIDDYESKKYPLEKISPIDAIKFEMDQNHLKPRDMKIYFGSPSRYYDIINKKRNLSLTMIKKLHKGLRIPYDFLIS